MGKLSKERKTLEWLEKIETELNLPFSREGKRVQGVLRRSLPVYHSVEASCDYGHNGGQGPAQ